MSDPKYRHRGYQNGGGYGESSSQSRPPKGPRPEPQRQRIEGAPRGRSAGAPGPAVFKCSMCSAVQHLADPLDQEAKCACGADLHTCRNCKFFDSTTHWECREPQIQARVNPKDARNTCAFFAPRIIRDLSADKVGPKVESVSDARKAFESLFKK